MSTSASSVSLFRRFIKWPLRLLFILLILIMLLGGILLLLPTFVSTGYFKQLLEHKTSSLLHRHVQFDKLDCSWSGEIELKGLKIDDDPVFSYKPIISMESLILRIDIRNLLKSCLDFDLAIEGLDAGLIRNPDGLTNLEAILAHLQGVEKQKQEPSQKTTGDFSLSLPFDIKGHIQLNDAVFQMHDRIRERILIAEDISLLLDAPLMGDDAVVTLNFSMNEEIDGIPIPPVKIFLRIESIFDSERSLSLDKAALALKGTLPGLNFDLRGEGGGTSVKGTVELDASPIAVAAQPFITAVLPDVSGIIKADLAIAGNPLESLNLSASITGTGLSASGGPLKTERLGPLNFRLIQEGSFNLPDGTLNINTGEIWLQENSSIFLKGVIQGLKDLSPVADLVFGPVLLDLEELLPPIKDLIPRTVSFNKEVQYTPKSPFRLNLDEAKINGSLLSGSARVDLMGLEVSLPFTHVKISEGSFSAEDVSLQIPRADFILESAFPVRVDISTGLDIKNLNINFGEEIYLERINVPSLNLVATNIKKSPEALFGVSTELLLDESAKLTGLKGLSRVEIQEISHSLQAECLLDNNYSALINIKHLSIFGPFPSLKDILGQDMEADIALEAKVAGFNLKGLDPFQFSLKEIETQFDIREMVKGGLEANNYDTESGNLDIQGHINLKADNLVPLIPVTLLSKSDLKGSVDFKWDLLGTMPEKHEIEQLYRDETPFYERLRQVGFLKRLEVITSLNSLSLKLAAAKDSFLRISRIQTEAPIELSLENGLKKGDIGGKIELAGIEEIPLLGRLDKPANISLAFSLEEEDLKTARFSETVSINLLNLTQSASVSLENIDRILANKSRSVLSEVLKRANGFASGKIRADIKPDLAIPFDGTDINGRVEAGAEIRLAGGKSLDIRTWAESPGLDANLGPEIRIINLQSNMDFEKSYKLISAKEENTQETTGPSPLSLSVINPESESDSFIDGRAGAARRIMDDLRGLLNAKRSLHIEMAAFPAGALPIKIYNHEMELRLVEGLPNVDYFQMDLMGGTLAGYLSISKNNEDFLLGIHCALSNLNATGLLPDELKGITGEDAELSGRLSLSLPVSQDSRRLLQELRLNLELTHIGAQTLERMLYAMDPYESNETIVQQRKLLGIGSPKWIKLLIENGSLSLSGQLEAKGISLDLPQIERLNLTNLPVHRQLEARLAVVGALNNLLKMISSDSIYIDDDGIIGW